jgi:hypothetical protein
MKDFLVMQGLVHYPAINNYFETEVKISLIEKITDIIKAKRNAILFLNNKSIVSASIYSLLIENDTLYVLVFNNTTNKLEHIDVSTIGRVGEDSFNDEYRDLEKKENVFHTQLISEFTSDSNSGWRNYWREFNKYGKYNVGVRTQYWNNIKNIEFVLLEQPDIQCNIEVVSKFGRNKELVIHLLILFEERNEKLAEEFLESFPKAFFENNKDKGFRWVPSYGKKRLKVELAQTNFKDIQDDKCDQDPRLYPIRPLHFQWFKKQLDEIAIQFKEKLK